MTSMDCDGTKAGYDIALTGTIAEHVSIPVIASGGAGTMKHFYEALTEGKADAALAASLFHYKELEIRQVKEYLAKRGRFPFGFESGSGFETGYKGKRLPREDGKISAGAERREETWLR